MHAPFIVGFGGTSRANSSGEIVASAVLSEAKALGARVQFFGGAALAALPHFAPENRERTPEQTAFVQTVREADGLVIATPGYHGGVSGLVKNAIDLLEDLREDRRPYFDGRAVGLIVTAAGWQACGVTLMSMRGIVHAMRGWPTPQGITVNTVAQRAIVDGRIADPALVEAIALQARHVVQFATGAMLGTPALAAAQSSSTSGPK
jgi:FMN reductase